VSSCDEVVLAGFLPTEAAWHSDAGADWLGKEVGEGVQFCSLVRFADKIRNSPALDVTEQTTSRV
jgi:hypothetical protein